MTRPAAPTPASNVDVFVRIRPPVQDDAAALDFVVEHEGQPRSSLASLSLQNVPRTMKVRAWKGSKCFADVFDKSTDNDRVYKRTVEETLEQVLHSGGAASFSAYGHSGSGKTHTIFGRQGLSGISLLAAQAFLRVIDLANKDCDDASPRLGLGMKLFEMRNKTACDLLNDRTECFVREGPDGKTHIRGATEMLEGGKVRVKPIRTVTCWTWEELDQTLKYGLAQRTSGTSTIHDESSRTHAILQLEVISDTLLRARENVTEKEAELVPVGKDATGVYLEEHGRAWTRDAAGNIQRNPEYTIDQARIDAAEALKTEYQERLDKAIQTVEAILAVPSYPRLGARLVFVDLAGAEFNDDRAGSDRTFQTAEERRATRQINTDLMALKEVMRAHASRQKRIPFRGSPLTMVLREHFTGDDHASMIATVSSDGEQYPATLNTVRFASLVGAAA